ncbi:hypothetical protein ASZ90_010005 [hydrocarbon metagenome]|uniref:Uncharacterized protein n=1 Tax=hydrocarbon metagenome TaxID=938273 RepID=A0A0W8FHA5_9ZZZZ
MRAQARRSREGQPLTALQRGPASAVASYDCIVKWIEYEGKEHTAEQLGGCIDENGRTIRLEELQYDTV